MDELVKQVEILGQTVQTMIQRSEQLFKMQEERSALLSESVQNLKQTIENLQVTDEALKRSLSEVDGQVDDLAKITAALLSIQQQQSGTAA